MIVIGVSGRIGSGKSKVCEYFSNRYGANRLKFSDILKDILSRLYLPPERENFQKLGKSLRDAFGDDIVAKAMKQDIAGVKGGIVVVDGVRYRSEAEMIKSFENSFIIYVKAATMVRYERTLHRSEKGEEKNSYKKFLISENAETEKHIDEVEALADFVVVNEGSFEELYSRLDEISEKILKSQASVE